MKNPAFKPLIEILLQNTKNISDNPPPKPFSPPIQKVYRQGQTGMEEGVYRLVYEGKDISLFHNAYFSTSHFLLLSSTVDGQTLVERLVMVDGGGLRRILDSSVIHPKPLADLTPSEAIRPYAELQRFERKLPVLWYEKDELERVMEE